MIGQKILNFFIFSSPRCAATIPMKKTLLENLFFMSKKSLENDQKSEKNDISDIFLFLIVPKRVVKLVARP